MAKKIKMVEVKTGKVVYGDEIVDKPMSLESLVQQGLIPGIKSKTFSEMNEEEKRVYLDLKQKFG